MSFEQAIALWDQGSYLEAKTLFERLARVNPEASVPEDYLGRIAQSLGAWSEAESHFERAIAIARSPDEAAPLQGRLGYLYWIRSDDEAAIPLFQSAMQADPGNWRLASCLASALSSLGRGDEISHLMVNLLKSGGPWTENRLSQMAAQWLVDSDLIPHFWQGIRDYWQELGIDEGDAPWLILKDFQPKRVSLCMIVRDEEERLPALLESVQGMVDEVLIADTGSVDASVEIAERYGAKVRRIPWTRDFSAARMESVQGAIGDWIFVLDADCIVDAHSRRWFKRFLQRPTIDRGELVVYSIQILNHLDLDDENALEGFHRTAIFPNDPNLYASGAIHEQVADRLGRPFAFRLLSEMVVHHYGYARSVLEKRNKHERNLDILRHELEAKPDDPRLLFGLAQQLAAQEKWQDALSPLMQCLEIWREEVESVDRPYQQGAYRLLLDLLLSLGRWQDATQVADEAIGEFPDLADFYGMSGHAHLMLKNTDQAIADCMAARRRSGQLSGYPSSGAYSSWLGALITMFAYHLQGDESERQAWENNVQAEATDLEYLNRMRRQIASQLL